MKIFIFIKIKFISTFIISTKHIFLKDEEEITFFGGGEQPNNNLSFLLFVKDLEMERFFFALNRENLMELLWPNTGCD